jgi:glyoxylase-like metal-dependent hydrolase (beta-lactamase superfamily II)
MDDIHVGDLTVTPIFDGTAILDTTMFTVGDSPTDWSSHSDLLDANGRLTVPVGAFVMRVGDEVILFDAGVGDVHDEMFDGGSLLVNLEVAGYRPEDITVIMVSHLHTDHCGWLVHNDAVTFPQATVHVGAADWEFYVTKEGGGSRRADRLRVVEDHVSLIDRDDVSIAPGVTTRSTPGHTPGHTSAVIASGTHRLIVLGDALHCPAQLTETEWQFLYDVDRDLAQKTRESLVREADDPNTALLPCHFPGMTAARLIQGHGKKNWVFN